MICSLRPVPAQSIPERTTRRGEGTESAARFIPTYPDANRIEVTIPPIG
jgi:hypothetical protein